MISDEENFQVRLAVQDPGGDPEAARERIKQQVQQRQFDGLLVLPEGLAEALSRYERRAWAKRAPEAVPAD